MKSLIAVLLATCGSLFAQTTGSHSGPWEIEVSGSGAGLRGVHAVGAGVVWASGTGGTVLRSEDSGYEWQTCATPPGGETLDFRAVWAWDAYHAFALSSGPGELSRLYRTEDGCSHWTLVMTNSDPDGFWDGLLFINRDHGLIYGDPTGRDGRKHEGRGDEESFQEGHLLETHDGGQSWTREPLPPEPFFAASNSSMAAYDGMIWAGTGKSRALRRKPNGSWEAAAVPLASGNDSSGVFSVAFRDRAHGVAVGGDYRKPEGTAGTAAFSRDGGAHWTVATTPPHGFRSAVAWDAAHAAWISAGSNGSDISYDDGRTWQWLDSGSWNALSLPWVVGPKGRIGKLGTLPAVAHVSR